MNDFKKSLKTQKNSHEKQKQKELKDKIAVAVAQAIKDIDVENSEDQIMKTEYMLNLFKIICHYEELRPIFTKFFEEKKENDKWNKSL